MLEYIIKKYPNRRLYDTEQSKYITVSDVKELIISGKAIQVLDSTSNEDLTRTILLQIIIESESAGEPIFSSNLLQQIIRFYGSSFQNMFAKYMEESMQFFIQQPFIEQQADMKENFVSDPVAAMTKLTENNIKAWQDMQKGFFNSFSSSTKNDKKKS
ncbi:MAG: polyhydroxyalkanoate synthesis repressor PhaR [Gammaproteobacteria bacterium]|nr:polyhydroxyalkanoate synthesis repressor PhaR [Gammaproteobacteria bacterium]